MNKKVLIYFGILTIIGVISYIVFISLRDTQFELEEKYYNNYQIIDIDAKKYKELVKKKENFILYLYLDGCTTCAEFKPVAESFLDDADITAYRIEYQELKKTNLEIEYAPSFILIKNGKVKAYLDAASDDDLKYYKNKGNLKLWVGKYVILKRG